MAKSICATCLHCDIATRKCTTKPAVIKYDSVIPEVITACDEYTPNALVINGEQANCDQAKNDPVNSPNHYVGQIECIDYLRDKLTPAEFTGFCMGNVLKYCSRWRKKDGLQDLKKAKVYLEWAIDAEEKHGRKESE